MDPNTQVEEPQLKCDISSDLSLWVLFCMCLPACCRLFVYAGKACMWAECIESEQAVCVTDGVESMNELTKRVITLNTDPGWRTPQSEERWRRKKRKRMMWGRKMKGWWRQLILAEMCRWRAGAGWIKKWGGWWGWSEGMKEEEEMALFWPANSLRRMKKGISRLLILWLILESCERIGGRVRSQISWWVGYLLEAWWDEHLSAHWGGTDWKNRILERYFLKGASETHLSLSV